MVVNLHVDLETLQLIQGPGQRSAVSSLRFKRGDAARIQVIFLENGISSVPIGDPDALEIQIGIKPRNQFDHSYLAHSADWSMPAEGDDTPTYECELSLNTLQLNSALNVGSATAEELPEITLMGEITWREGNGEPTSTRTFLVVVENDVNRGTEGAPSDANPGNITLTGTILASNLSGTNTGDQDLSGLAPIAHTHFVADIVSVASQRLIGRHAGDSGAAQEIQTSGGIEFSGGTIRRSALTGDVTASAGSNATTIANDTVSNAKLANMATATIKGRTTAGTGDPEDLTAAQALALIGAATPASVSSQIAAGFTLVPEATINFANSSRLREGMTDAGNGGAGGVALVCSLDYEFKWEAGRLYVMGQDGFTIRAEQYGFNDVPTATDDSTKGYVVGSRRILDDGRTYVCVDSTTDNAVWVAAAILAADLTPSISPNKRKLIGVDGSSVSLDWSDGITETVYVIGNSGAAQTIALKSGTFQTVALTGNCVFTMPTATAGKSFILKVMTGAGGFAATFTGVKWPDNIAPVITSTAGRYDLISFIADGAAWSGSAIQNFTT